MFGSLNPFTALISWISGWFGRKILTWVLSLFGVYVSIQAGWFENFVWWILDKLLDFAELALDFVKQTELGDKTAIFSGVDPNLLSLLAYFHMYELFSLFVLAIAIRIFLRLFRLRS